MDVRIQFLGIILFVANINAPLEAILPIVSNVNGVPDHQAFIMFQKGTAIPTKWPARPVLEKDGKPWQDANGREWDYVELGGESVRFEHNISSQLVRPDFLSRLKDCCMFLGSITDEFQSLEKYPPAAAHVLLSTGEAGWTKRNFRVDTIFEFTTSSALRVVATKGTDVRYLTFAKANSAELVIGNFPMGYIPHNHSHGSPKHFEMYRKMVRLDTFCSVPSKKTKCRPRTDSSSEKPPVLVLKNIPYGLDIDCSNSQYP